MTEGNVPFVMFLSRWRNERENDTKKEREERKRREKMKRKDERKKREAQGETD